MTIIGVKSKTGQLKESARGLFVVSCCTKTLWWLRAHDLLPYYLTLLSSVTLINTSSYAVKLWPSVWVRWGCLSDGCLQNTGMDGGLCNGGSRGVVVNRAETYFLLTFIMNWQPELICVSKWLHTYKDAPFLAPWTVADRHHSPGRPIWRVPGQREEGGILPSSPAVMHGPPFNYSYQGPLFFVALLQWLPPSHLHHAPTLVSILFQSCSMFYPINYKMKMITRSVFIMPSFYFLPGLTYFSSWMLFSVKPTSNSFQPCFQQQEAAGFCKQALIRRLYTT